MSEKVIPVDNADVSSATSEDEKTGASELIGKLKKEKENWKARAIEADAKTKELEAKLKIESEAKLIEKENWKALAEQRAQELESVKADKEKTDRMILESQKVAALKSELSKMGMDSNYMDIAIKVTDLNTITIDKETNTVLGVESAAKAIREKAAPLFKSAPVGVSHAAPQGITTPLTLESWKALPYKEKLEAEKELYKGLGIEIKP